MVLGGGHIAPLRPRPEAETVRVDEARRLVGHSLRLYVEKELESGHSFLPLLRRKDCEESMTRPVTLAQIRKLARSKGLEVRTGHGTWPNIAPWSEGSEVVWLLNDYLNGYLIVSIFAGNSRQPIYAAAYAALQAWPGRGKK